MKKILFAVLFLSSCMTFQKPPVARFVPSVTTAERSVSSLATDDEIEATWKQPDNNRKDSMIRSNPTHFWAWMKKNAPNNLRDVTDYQGQVVADAHYFNFGDVHGDKENGLAVVDVDDSGDGSFYLDFVRYAVFVKAYLVNDYTKELYDAYTDGLAGKDKDLPDFLKQPIKKSRKDLIFENNEWIQKNLTKDYDLRNDLLGLKSFSDLRKEAEDLQKEIKKIKDPSLKQLKIKELAELEAKPITGKELEDLLVKQKKVQAIYDHGYMVTDSGSSSGMNRFWYSVMTNNNGIRIMECKQFGEPATSHYAKQSQHAERVANVLKYYSDVATNDNFVFDITDSSYWCRLREFQFFGRQEVEKNRKDLKKMIEYSRYIAFWMGRKQKLQKDSDKLLAELKRDPEQTINDTIKLIVTYELETDLLGKKYAKKKKN